MESSLEKLIKIAQRHIGTFFVDYKISKDEKTKYSEIASLRLHVDAKRFSEISIVKNLKTGDEKISCYYVVEGEAFWGFNDVPHHKELRSFPYHIHSKGEIEVTEIRTIDEALSYIEKHYKK